MTMRLSGLLVAAAALVAIGAVFAHAEGPTTFDEAKTAAAEADKPLLVDFFATWCGPCKAFTAASATNPNLKSVLAEEVVLFKTDAEKGEGLDLARLYDVTGYPTFVLMNAEGKTIDRWVGYGSADWFIGKLTAGTADSRTLGEKLDALTKQPTAETAAKIAAIRSAQGRHGDAIAYYRRAAALDPSMGFEVEMLEAMYGGMRTGMFAAPDVLEQAKAVARSSNVEPADMIDATFMVRSIALDAHDSAAYAPFVARAMEAVESLDENEYAGARRALEIDHALYVEQDADRAIELKKAGFDEGWMDRATELNSFAWWCFENSINLEEAEILTRRGVELAAQGREQGNILDTLAEICNLKGNCGEAVELMKRAVAQDPDNDYFREQLARFEELLSRQS